MMTAKCQWSLLRPSVRLLYWTIMLSSTLTWIYLLISNNPHFYPQFHHLQRRDIPTAIKTDLEFPLKLSDPLANSKKNILHKNPMQKGNNSIVLDNMTRTLAERLNRLESYCKGYLNDPKIIDLKSQMLKDKTRWFHSNNPILKGFNKNKKNGSKVKTIKWCPIYKAGSSPWFSIFMKSKLTPKTEQMIREGKTTFIKLAQTLRMLRSHPRALTNAETKRREIQNGDISMIVVRHPFERILSAYRDKLERLDGKRFYNKKFGQPIIKKFRGKIVTPIKIKHTERSGKGTAMTGPEMASHDITPTFNEFVHFLLQETNPIAMDEHWRPFYVDCNACQGPKFNLILKVETMNQDRDYLLQRLGVAIPRTNTTNGEYDELDETWKRWSNSVNKNESGVFETSKLYYGQLSKTIIRKLYDLYEPDFKMFGYSPHKYIKTAL